MTMLIDLIVVITAYLLGSISSAIIVCRLMGLPNPREQGSGNPGASNVLRIGGKKAASITLVGDTLKGLIPVSLARLIELEDPTVGAVALAAVVGHLYPIFFNFKGGKGVATTLGVVLGINWLLGLVWAGSWLLVAAIFRISSLSALTATSLMPFYTYWLVGSPWLVAMTIIIAVLIIWRHRSNIRNLLDGTESQIRSRT